MKTLLLIITILFAGCTENLVNPVTVEYSRGVVHFNKENNQVIIRDYNGPIKEIINMPAEFKVDGLGVKYLFDDIEDYAYGHTYNQVIVTFIERELPIYISQSE